MLKRERKYAKSCQGTNICLFSLCKSRSFPGRNHSSRGGRVYHTSLRPNTNNPHGNVRPVNNRLTDASLRRRFTVNAWLSNTDLQSNTLSSILWKVVSNCIDCLVRVKPRNATGVFSCRGKRQSAHFLSQTVTHAGTFLFSSSNNWHLRDLNQKHYGLSTSAYNIL